MSESERPKVAIIDYGMGNLFSVARACEHAGMLPLIVTSAAEAADCDGLILPGVGAFADAMQTLERQGLIPLLQEYAAANRPLLGICLGMQLMMQESFEFGRHRGLGFFAGQVVRFEQAESQPDSTGKVATKALKVPQVGWNTIAPVAERSWQGTLLEGLSAGTYLYYVHSYYVRPQDPALALASTRYGNTEFCACIQRGNIFACQAHPEKSAQAGLRIYQNFASRVRQQRQAHGGVA